MKNDLGSSEQVRKANEGHLKDIEAFEKEIRLKLRQRLLTEAQCAEIGAL